MIAECMKRRAADACGDCAMKGVCNHKWSRPEGKAVDGWPRPARSSPDNPVLGLFDAFAKAITQRPADSNSLRRRVEAGLEPMLESGEVSLDRLAGELGMSRATRFSTGSASASLAAISGRTIIRSRRRPICSAFPTRPPSRAPSSAGLAKARANFEPDSILDRKRAAPKGRPSLSARMRRLELHIGLVADEAHLRHPSLLGHGQDLVDQLIARFRLGL
jgi:hypothetical protein